MTNDVFNMGCFCYRVACCFARVVCLCVFVQGMLQSSRVNELQKEIQSLRERVASPSALIIQDLTDETAELLIGASITTEKISGNRFSRAALAKDRSILESLKVWKQESPPFPQVEYKFKAADEPTAFLFSKNEIKVLYASVTEENGETVVRPLLRKKDLQSIRSAKDFFKRSAEAISEMGQHNFDLFQEIITKWEQVDLAFQGGVKKIAQYIGKLAINNQDILEAIVNGWNSTLRQGKRYKGDKMDVKKMGKMLTKAGENQETVSLKHFKNMLDQAIEQGEG